MSDSASFRAGVNEAYREFFQTAERKRRWSVFDDVPWDRLDSSGNSESKAVRIETYCAEEMYAPDYASNGLALTRTRFGSAWFQMCWTQEEAKHGLVFREYLLRSGLRSEAQMGQLEDDLFAQSWQLPFKTARLMACYGALQEAATFLAYKAQKELARDEGDEVLETIFGFVSRDEAAHAGFYREMVQLELVEDRTGTLADLAQVVAEFKMPGDGLIPRYQERLRTSGAGISPRHFVEHALLPMLRTLKTSRAELKEAQQASKICAAAPVKLAV
jgi:acyl-[acyl-carrier-protein] desaturase